MQPFGPDNIQPVFVSRNVSDNGSRIVKEQHIRFALRQGATFMDGIGFNLAGKFPLLKTGDPIDIVYSIEENEWNNQKNLQLKVIDFALSDLGSAANTAASGSTTNTAASGSSPTLPG
jgi:single-stranded-DNA-specific exonuclease